MKSEKTIQIQTEKITILEEKITILEESLKKLKAAAKLNLHKLLNSLKLLDPGKIYIFSVDSEQDKETVIYLIEEAKRLIPWTLPFILISDKDLKEYSKKEFIEMCKNAR